MKRINKKTKLVITLAAAMIILSAAALFSGCTSSDANATENTKNTKYETTECAEKETTEYVEEKTVSDDEIALRNSVVGWWGIPCSGVESIKIYEDSTGEFIGVHGEENYKGVWKVTGENTIELRLDTGDGEKCTLHMELTPEDTMVVDYGEGYIITYSRIQE